MADAIEIVRETMRAFNRRDIEALEALISNEIEFESTFAASEGRKFSGPTAVGDFYAAVDEAFQDVRIELVDEVARVDERIAIRVRVSGRGRGSGVEVDHVFGHVWTIVGGEIARVVSFSDPAEATRSIGLTS